MPSSFLAKTTQYDKTKPERNGIKYRKVLMEAEGLGKTLESRTVSRGKCGWASLVGYTCPAQGKEGSPVGQRMERNGKVEEADSCGS